MLRDRVVRGGVEPPTFRFSGFVCALPVVSPPQARACGVSVGPGEARMSTAVAPGAESEAVGLQRASTKSGQESSRKVSRPEHPYRSLRADYADYALAIGGMLDRPQVHRTAGSDWASPRRAPQAGRQLAGQFPHRAPQHVGHACHIRGSVPLLVGPGARDDHRSREFGMPRADGDPPCVQRRDHVAS